MVNMAVDLGGLKLRTPVATASGTFGYGYAFGDLVDYSKLGAVTTKGVRVQTWPGNPLMRHAEVPGGLVNAIGLQGMGVKHFLERDMFMYGLVKDAPPVIANIWGGSEEEYAETAAAIEAAKNPRIGAIEMNVSCPNVKEGGHTFGQDPKTLESVVKKVRAATTLPLLVKLAPNVPSIVPYVQACEAAGADGLSLINTIPAMVIDIERRRPVLGNRTGGLSGKCVHPAAVKIVYDAHQATKLPILAMGGIYEAKDAIEFLLAGATAVAIGTATFSAPDTAAKVCDGIAEYCERQGFGAVSEITGALCES